eukprot:5097723-Amphidinium_carterae.1
MPTPLLTPPIVHRDLDSDLSDIGDTLMPLPSFNFASDGHDDIDDDSTFTFDPMCFPPVQQMQDVVLSPSQQLPQLSGGAVDDADYQKILKHAVSVRPRQISGPQ